MGATRGGNASTFADMANVGALMREGCDPHENTYLNNPPEGRSERPLRSGAIAKIAILTPLSEGLKNGRNEPKMGSLPFVYISIIHI